MPTHRLISSYTRIPVPGGKLIEEIAGRASSGHQQFSFAHMVAPPGWGEPPQTPSFGELTVLVRGSMQVELWSAAGPERVTVAAGQSIWIEPGVRVRYSNPSAAESEYFALCLPAFAPDAAHREE
jgi:mannose-6-phosphate isomerase-like protein (cupin superfamily)